MTLFDQIVAVTVAVSYNMMSHCIVSGVTKDLSYDNKISKTVIAIVVAGVLAIVIAKKIEDKEGDRDKQVLSRGLWYGGLLLVITPVVAQWTGVTFDMQMVTLVLLLGGIVWASGKCNF